MLAPILQSKGKFEHSARNDNDYWACCSQMQNPPPTLFLFALCNWSFGERCPLCQSSQCIHTFCLCVWDTDLSCWGEISCNGLCTGRAISKLDLGRCQNCGYSDPGPAFGRSNQCSGWHWMTSPRGMVMVTIFYPIPN